MVNYEEEILRVRSEVATWLYRENESEPPLSNQLINLACYISYNYHDDNVAQTLLSRVLTSYRLSRIDGVENEDLNALRSERDRVAMWLKNPEFLDDLLYDDDNIDDVGRVLFELDACFNPKTGELEPWFLGKQEEALSKITAKYSFIPEGLPPIEV